MDIDPRQGCADSIVVSDGILALSCVATSKLSIYLRSTRDKLELMHLESLPTDGAYGEKLSVVS